ncbi:FKBP-type peptidyl-prolyl cis-trans isomerase [Parendozoicomonas haliclonae]|uniref:Peptidyl-prolyl cis-trans isomerase n=1 Tax=Parendozoicomonas haliclonae TaxID=1960125 RepID=A0A1X7AJ87_9GAMM|nr:FKBP-type peptidyl-prolyl cis-trans isomerase [Parendozoicomonas haliclonae]SMA45699.1 Outer membrane protein MIP precursor [Parendozoicomonas haliclonae]
MKVKLLVIALVLSLGALIAVLLKQEEAPTPAAEVATNTAPVTDAEKLSYSLGALFGTRMAEVYSDLDTNMVVAGISDALADKKLALSEQQMMEIIQKAQMEAAEKRQKEMMEQAQKNADKGAAFLKENGQKSDVVTTDSGLQYKVLSEGKGSKPDVSSEVTVNYEGKLLDGTIFDSSYERGQPATFRVNQVIQGWTEALQGMPEGSVWELYIPSDLAYGPGGAPQGGIGPNELLIFKVELIKVNQKAAN